MGRCISTNDCTGNQVCSQVPIDQTVSIVQDSSMPPIRVCLSDNTEFDHSIVCEVDNNGIPTGVKLAVIVSYTSTGIPTFTYWDLSTGIEHDLNGNSIAQCNDGTDIELEKTDMCDSGNDFIRWYVLENGEPNGVYYDTDLTGLTYTPAGVVSVGTCNSISSFESIIDELEELNLNVAKEAKQDTQILEAQSTNTKLDTLNSNDFATEAKQDTQIIEAQLTNTKLDTLNSTDFSTEAKQDDIIAEIQSTNTKLDTLNLNDFSTEAKQDTQILEVQSTNTKLDSLLLVDFATEAKQDNQITELQTLNLNDFSTEAKQDDIITEVSKTVGWAIGEYDYIATTYVVAGNGIGEVETRTFKTGGAGGTTIATLTYVYDANNRIISETKS